MTRSIRTPEQKAASASNTNNITHLADRLKTRASFDDAIEREIVHQENLAYFEAEAEADENFLSAFAMERILDMAKQGDRLAAEIRRSAVA